MSERRYRRSLGDPRGIAEDPTRCIEHVDPVMDRQCSLARAYDEDGLVAEVTGKPALYCKRHGMKHARTRA